MKITMQTDDIRFIFEKLSRFCSKEKARPVLGAVHLEFDNHICTAVASDGYALARHVCSCGMDDADKPVRMNIIPDKIKKFSLPLVTLTDENMEHRFLTLECGYDKQILKLEDAPYFRWENVVPPKLDLGDSHAEFAGTVVQPQYLRLLGELAGTGRRAQVVIKVGSAVQPVWCRVRENTTVMILPVRTNADVWDY